MTDTPITKQAKEIVDALDKIATRIRSAESLIPSVTSWIEAAEKGYHMTGIESYKDMIEEYKNERIETLAKLEEAKKEWNETFRTLS